MAGCVGPLGDVLGDDQVTAAEAFEMGRDRATDWREGAQATAAFGFEIPGSVQEEGAVLPAPPDPDPGDGEATGWRLTWRAPSARRTLEFTVLANGTILDPGPSAPQGRPEGEEADEAPQPLGAWSTSSADAASRARANATFASAEDEVRAQAGGVMYGLALARARGPAFGPNETRPTWFVVALPAEEDGGSRSVESGSSTGGSGDEGGEEILGVGAAVDARSGELLAVYRTGGLFEGFTGNLTVGPPPGEPSGPRTTYRNCSRVLVMGPSGGTARFRLPVADEASHAHVGANLTTAAPSDRVRVALVDGSGGVVASREKGPGTTRLTWNWTEELGLGVYRVRVDLQQGSARVEGPVRRWAGVPGEGGPQPSGPPSRSCS